MSNLDRLDPFTDIPSEGLAQKVSQEFVSGMRKDWSEGLLIAADVKNFAKRPGADCASHDFSDKNYYCLEALWRAVQAHSGVSLERAEHFSQAFYYEGYAEKDRVLKIWNEALNAPTVSGFSVLRELVSAEDFKTLGTSLMAPPDRDGYPERADNVLADREYESNGVTQLIQRREIDPSTLHAMAEAIRADDEATLAQLVDDVLGPKSPTP